MSETTIGFSRPSACRPKTTAAAATTTKLDYNRISKQRASEGTEAETCCSAHLTTHYHGNVTGGSVTPLLSPPTAGQVTFVIQQISL